MGQLQGQRISAMGNIQNRQVNAVTGIQGGNAAPYGGAESVGKGMMGQTIGKLGSDIAGLGLQYGLKGAEGGGGGGGSNGSPGALPQPGIGQFFAQSNPYETSNPRVASKYSLGDYTHGAGGYT